MTARDHHAAKLGATLAVEPQVDLAFDVAMDLPAPADPCTFGATGGPSTGDPFENTSQAMEDLQQATFRVASDKPWRAAWRVAACGRRAGMPRRAQRSALESARRNVSDRRTL
jgi:hypothetical protein